MGYPSRIAYEVVDAVVFGGQGSQRPGMARDFYLAFSESKAIFEQASDVLNYDIAHLCFEENELLNRTEYAQPAILTAEISIFQVLKEKFGIEPAYFGGHSLGEYSAIVAAEVVPLDIALRVVAARGALMQRVSEEGQGAMVALIDDKIAYEIVESTCVSHGCEIGNFNSPQQVVISGLADEVAAVVAESKGIFPSMRATTLSVAAPFHSRLMRAVESKFASTIERYRFSFNLANTPKVLSNYTGTFHNPFTFCSSLVRQISAPVRWLDNMVCLSRSSRGIVEISPQRVLSKFFQSLGIGVKCVSDLRGLERACLSQGAHAL